MLLNIMLILFSLLILLIFSVIFLNNKFELSNIELLINQTEVTPQHEKGIKTFSFEDKMLKTMKVKAESVKGILYVERFLLLSVVVLVFFMYKGFALLLIGGGLIIVYVRDMYQKVIYESGITNVPRIVNFINYFIPHITSGNSAEQSLIQYISYANDMELNEYYRNKDNPSYIIPTHLQQIIDIYDIAKYNEDKGNSDYVHILQELSEDISQKQVYYNKFVSGMGELGPTTWSYYIGVPFLVITSFSQTKEFWDGIGGYVISIALLILFAIFKFLIYKLQKDTIRTIF